MWTERLSREIAQRDEWLLQREARITSLEATVSKLETMLREREQLVRQCEQLSEKEIARREDTIREREARIARLEGQVRRLETPRLPPCTNDLHDRLRDVVTRLPEWCPEEKALWMADRIVQKGYKTAMELGVYAGRSVFPIALAIAANPGHAVYAVDAWDNAVATSAPISERDDVWWEGVDSVNIKSQFLRETISQNLVSLIKIIELPSAEACQTVSRLVGRGIDFLYVDGMHSETQALADVQNWSELVVSGGMIVLDDIDWSGVRRADEFLASRFERIEETSPLAFARLVRANLMHKRDLRALLEPDQPLPINRNQLAFL
jgi:predicted O-methyltransferase YrrM